MGLKDTGDRPVRDERFLMAGAKEAFLASHRRSLEKGKRKTYRCLGWPGRLLVNGEYQAFPLARLRAGFGVVCRDTRLASPQQGAVLIVLMIVLTIGLSAVLLSRFNPITGGIDRDTATGLALAEAKALLLDYAVTFDSLNPANAGRVGVFPCPDQSRSALPEGEQHAPCGDRHQSAMGRLPWRTLQSEPVKDGLSECLWYVVSGSHKADPSPEMLNEDTNGLLEVYAPDGLQRLAGSTPGDRAVAAVIAPGVPVTGQDRVPEVANDDRCPGNYGPANYLECLDTASGGLCGAGSVGVVDNRVVAAGSDDLSALAQGPNATGTLHAIESVNDRVVFITREDLARVLLGRGDLWDKLRALTQKVAECIADFGAPTATVLPWPAPLDLDDYRQSAQYNDEENLFAGRVPDEVDELPGPAVSGLIINCTRLSSEQKVLWQNWKDHFFYAVAKEFSPAGSAGGCDPSNCLSVIAASGNFAGVVFFAGPRLAGQSRAAPPPLGDPDEKSFVSNYLEEPNAPTFVSSPPVGTEVYAAGPASDIFNDVLLCIDDQTPKRVLCSDSDGNPCAVPCP
jgi:hypothetical protein